MNDNLINNLEYTVSELSNSIKRIIEDNFDYIRIKAEIGRVSKPNSGHIYLDLKDDASVISGIVWKGNVNKLDIIPEEGLEVVCTGKVTTYSGQSKYQIIIENMEPAGIGALMALLEKRKDKLLKDLKFNQIKISGVEGQNSNEWILLDLGDIVINIMSDDSRKLFDLESLWDPALK